MVRTVEIASPSNSRESSSRAQKLRIGYVEDPNKSFPDVADVHERIHVLAFHVPALGGAERVASYLRRWNEASGGHRESRRRVPLVAIVSPDERNLTALIGVADIIIDDTAGTRDFQKLSSAVAGSYRSFARAAIGASVEATKVSSERYELAPFWLDPEEFEEIRSQIALPSDDPAKRD